MATEAPTTVIRSWYDGRELCVVTGANLRGAKLTGADLRVADLRGADLTGANLTDADLTGADLTDANLRGADLRGAKIHGETILRAGLTWREYLADVVPALLQAGGRSLAEVATPEHWTCHTWTNCPMAVAFGARSLAEVPALYRGEASLFVTLFDAGALPLSAIAGAPEPEQATT